jgi:hypothetical protein
LNFVLLTQARSSVSHLTMLKLSREW